MDAQLCSASNGRDLSAYIREMRRILKSNGRFIVVSHGRPVENGRLEYLNKCAGSNAWSSVEHRVIRECNLHVCYVSDTLAPGLDQIVCFTLLYFTLHYLCFCAWCSQTGGTGCAGGGWREGPLHLHLHQEQRTHHSGQYCPKQLEGPDYLYILLKQSRCLVMYICKILIALHCTRVYCT